MPREERLHVGERVDGDALAPDLAERAGVVRVVAHERRHVEGGREPGLTVLREVAEALVRLLRGAEAGELAHRPQPPAVHRRVHPARERVLARDSRGRARSRRRRSPASRAARSRCPRSSRRARRCAPARVRRRSRARRRATRPRRDPRSSPSRRIVGAVAGVRPRTRSGSLIARTGDGWRLRARRRHTRAPAAPPCCARRRRDGRRVRRRLDDCVRGSRMPQRRTGRRVLLRGSPGHVPRSRRAGDDHRSPVPRASKPVTLPAGSASAARGRARTAATSGSRPASHRCPEWIPSSTRRSPAKARRRSSCCSQKASPSGAATRSPSSRSPDGRAGGACGSTAGPPQSLCALRGSSGRWAPIATAESWNAGTPACNSFGFRFERVSVSYGGGGSWRPFVSGHRFLDGAYSLRDLAAAPAAPGVYRRTLASKAVVPYAFVASSS